MNPHLEQFYIELELAKEQGLLDHQSRLVMHYSATGFFYESYEENLPLPVKYAIEIQIHLQTSPNFFTRINELSKYLQSKYQLEFVFAQNHLIARILATKEDIQRLPTSVSKHISSR